MQIVYALDTGLTTEPTILTIGKFDGFHVGHQLLVRTAVERARQGNCFSAVQTFDPLPSLITHPEQDTKLISSLEERIELIASFNPDLLIVAPFNHTVMRTSANDYMKQICSAMPLRELWMGPNFVLGHNREGTISCLMEIGKDLGYTVGSIAPLLIEGAPVSSSRVRKMLEAGIVEGIEILLGRGFRIRGKVVHGEQRGRTIGFPTANLEVDSFQALPAHGVYACFSYIEKAAIPAVVNIGVRPTFGTMQQTIEAHMLDWEGNLYGEVIQLEFLSRLRSEKRFASIEHLQEQIHRDIAQARELFARSLRKPSSFL